MNFILTIVLVVAILFVVAQGYYQYRYEKAIKRQDKLSEDFEAEVWRLGSENIELKERLKAYGEL